MRDLPARRRRRRRRVRFWRRGRPAEGDPPNAFGDRGDKVGIPLPAGTTATLSVPTRLRSHVGLVHTPSAVGRVRAGGTGDAEVRFSACRYRWERTGWAGGIVVDRPRCARLGVKLAGKPSIARRVPIGRAC